MLADREIYATDGKYYLYVISEDDRTNYVELQRQVKGPDTFFLNPLCKDMMWEIILKSDFKIFSVYDREDFYCGSLEVQNIDSRTPELGIDLLESRRNQGIAATVIRLLCKKIYDSKKMDYFLIRIASGNRHSKYVFEKMGAIFLENEGSTVERFKEFVCETFGDQNLEKWAELYTAHEKDETVLRYKLLPEVVTCEPQREQVTGKNRKNEGENVRR